MSYSTLYLKKGQKLLTILSILAVISFVVGGLFFFGEMGKKNGWEQIKGIEKMYIVNRSAHGFEVVWSTNIKNTQEQWIEVGTSKNNYPIIGKSDSLSNPHHAVISGLQADTLYYYRMRVGTKTYILPSLTVGEVRTPKEIKEKPLSPAYGRVVLPTTKPYSNGLLIYEIDGMYPLAVFTKQTGEWLIPLTGLVEKKSNSIVSTRDSAQVLIRLFSFPEGAIQTTVGQTRPLKQVIMAGSLVHLAQSLGKKEESILGVSTQNLKGSENVVSRIMYPKENAIIPGNSPLIRGTAPAGKEILILIQGSSKQYSYRTNADEKGDWVVQTPVALEFGKYSIVVTIKNGAGATTIVRRSFTIIKSGEQVLGEATASPTLAPTVVVPTYANPTSIPADVPTPTFIPPTIMTQYPTASTDSYIPTATPPVTGGAISGYLFGALFFIVIGTGLVLAF